MNVMKTLDGQSRLAISCDTRAPPILAVGGVFQGRGDDDQKRPAGNAARKLWPGQLISSAPDLSSFFLFVGVSASFPPFLSSAAASESLWLISLVSVLANLISVPAGPLWLCKIYIYFFPST